MGYPAVEGRPSTQHFLQNLDGRLGTAGAVEDVRELTRLFSLGHVMDEEGLDG